MNNNSIERLASDVVDTGRRGEPKPGCDCMQCFGYCLVDRDAAVRQQALLNDAGYRAPAYNAPLDAVIA